MEYRLREVGREMEYRLREVGREMGYRYNARELEWRRERLDEGEE